MSDKQPKVNLRDTAGNTVAVDADVVPDLLDQGWELESEAGRVERIVETELERAYGDRPIAAAALGATEALTLGGSTALLGALGDPEWQREIRARSPIASGVGEAAGHVAGALATGGAGLLAKTPAALAARGARAVIDVGARQGLRTRTAMAALGLGAEGALQGAGQYIADLSLREDPEFSAEALLDSMQRGALIGGTVGAAGGVASSAAARLKGLAVADDAGSLLGRLRDMGPGDLQRAGKTIGSSDDLTYRDLIPAAERTPAKVGQRAQDVVSQVDEATGYLQKARKETRQLLGPDSTAAAPPQGVALARAELNVALEGMAAATRQAKKWQRNWSRSLGPEDLGKGKLPALSDDQAKGAIETLGRLDNAAAALDDALGRTRQLVGPVSDVAQAPGMRAKLARLGDKAQDVAGVMTLGQDLGLPVPGVRDIPGIGPALDAYLKFRLARNALRGRGKVRGTPQTRAAQRVSRARDRLSSAVASIGRGIPQIATTAVRASRAIDIAKRLGDGDTQDVRMVAAGEADGLPAEISDAAQSAAERKIEYLQSIAPKPPAAGTPFAAENWEPTDLATAQFAAQLDAIERPFETAESLLRGSWQNYATAQARAIKHTSPSVWAQIQSELTADIETITRNVPYATRARVGQLFEVPLTVRQYPRYAAVTKIAEAMQQQPMETDPSFGAPTAKAESVKMSATAEERRQYRR